MTSLTDDENRYYEEQKNAAFVEKRFVIRIKKEDLNYIKKSEIIVISQENLEELLIAFVIYTINYPKKFL